MSESLSTNPKKESGLTQTSLDHLLSRLGPDQESAAAAYLELRRALFTYFAMKGAADPDQLIDETIDRTARRLSEGQTIFTEKPASYFYGVARNVWREHLPKTGLFSQLVDETLQQSLSSATPHDLLVETLERKADDKRMNCLEKCLGSFTNEDRDLIIGYYHHNGGTKIENRRAMALRAGISLDSLRHRLARLRIKLGSCIERCMKLVDQN